MGRFLAPPAGWRRGGPSSRGAVVAAARDVSRARLQEDLEKAAGERLLNLSWRSTLLPRPFDRLVTRLPFGDAIGVAAELSSRRHP